MVNHEQKRTRTPRTRRRRLAPAFGVRSLVHELLHAVDSSLRRRKVLVAALTGLLGGLGLFAADAFAPRDSVWGLTALVGLFLFLVALVSLSSVWLSQETSIEVMRRGAARSSEVRAGVARQAPRLFLALVVLAGTYAAVILALFWASAALGRPEGLERSVALDWLEGTVRSLRLVFLIGALPFGLSLLLLGPIFVVEDCGLFSALREWLTLLRRNLGRIYFYETLALVLAVVMTLPLLFPVVGVVLLADRGRALGVAEVATLLVLGGIALTPFLAYLLVANLFIYLNLRYEFSYQHEQAPTV